MLVEREVLAWVHKEGEKAYRPPSANIPNNWILEVRETCNRHRLGIGKDRMTVSEMMLSILISC